MSFFNKNNNYYAWINNRNRELDITKYNRNN